MGEWKMVSLGEIFHLIRNGAGIKQGERSGGIPITRIETISAGVIDRNKFGYAGVTGDKYRDYYLEDGDILMSHINSEKHLGKVAIFKKCGEDRVIHGMNLLCLRTEKMYARYALYYFRSQLFKRQIPKITKKSVNQASFTVTSLKELKIPYPPPDEQMRIAENLDLVSGLIKGYRELLTELDKLIRSLFYEMFGDPVTNEKGWETQRFGENIKLLNGKAYKQEELLEKGKYPVLRVGNFFSNRSWYYSDLELNEDKYCDNGDLLYAWSASFGPRIWDGGKVIYHYHIWRVDITANYDKVFLCRLMDYLTQSLMNDTHGIAMMHLTKSGMEKMKVIVPPFPVQTGYADIVNAIEARKARAQAALDETLKLFDSFMQEYF